MILLIVFAVMFMGIALLLAMYSSFLPFVQNYGNTMQYSAAYYGALSAIERGALAATYAGPGFDGESGWSGKVLSGVDSDAYFTGFYTYGNGIDTLRRKVSSSTTQIPLTGKGNVAPDFWTGDESSKNWNQLNYNISEVIALGSIGSGEIYHRSLGSYTTPQFQDIQVKFRFNPLLKERFARSWNLKKDLDNKAFVNWTINGNKEGSPFSIIPNEARSTRSVNSNQDTLLRGFRFNAGELTMTLGSNQALLQGNNSDNIMNIIAGNEDTRKTQGYSNLLHGTTGTKLTLDLVNILKAGENNNQYLYPFLEYQIRVNGGKISDRFYTIEGEGKVGNYNIKMRLQKPTLPQPALGNFTIIF